MQNLELKKTRVVGKDVTIISWLDSKDRQWHAFSPDYINIAYDGRGATGETRDEAMGNYISLLAEYIEEE